MDKGQLILAFVAVITIGFATAGNIFVDELDVVNVKNYCDTLNIRIESNYENTFYYYNDHEFLAVGQGKAMDCLKNNDESICAQQFCQEANALRNTVTVKEEVVQPVEYVRYTELINEVKKPVAVLDVSPVVEEVIQP